MDFITLDLHGSTDNLGHRKCPRKICAQGQLSFHSHRNENTQFIAVIDLCSPLDHTENNLLKTLLNLSPSQIVNIVYRKVYLP